MQKNNKRNINFTFKKISEINKIINEIIKIDNIVIVYSNNENYLNDNSHNYLIILKTTVYLYYYNVFERKRKYLFSKLDSDEEQIIFKGRQAYCYFKKFVKQDISIDLKEIGIKDIDELGKVAGNIYYNNNYNFTRVKAYEYDLNSAFAFGAINCKLPILFLRKNDYLKNDMEIGFSNIDNHLIVIQNKNFKCDFIFKIGEIEEFRNFFIYYFQKKKNSKNKIERNKYKNIINMSIGYFQLVNPFIRCVIINWLNEYVSDLIEKNKNTVILSNCDSLVTIKDISSKLVIGDDLGEFKIERENEDFYLYNSNYQWNLEPPTFRGTPKAWFNEFKKRNKEKFDLAKNNVNNLDILYNIYYFDLKDMQFKKVR